MKEIKVILWLIFWMLCLLTWVTISPVSAYSQEIDLNAWADSIFIAEGGVEATFLYGIRSIPYKDEAQARQYCKNTVYNTLVKYRESRCKEGESNIDCLARRYAPIGVKNDPKNLNRHWKKNVLANLPKEQK